MPLGMRMKHLIHVFQGQQRAARSRLRTLELEDERIWRAWTPTVLQMRLDSSDNAGTE
jgi:hypothetical protein